MMTKLALYGGKPAVEGPLSRFNTISEKEMINVISSLNSPLSGYLGGKRHGGYWVERLEKEWAERFGVKRAIACNSATSGLLLACMATEVGYQDPIIVSPYTMSASAAAPALLGALPIFGDIDSEYFCLESIPNRKSKAIIVTNLFGQPAKLHLLLKLCEETGSYLIEDNAQSIFAKEGKIYAGTIGHIGVFSLNVHKHLQCGEGGICVTDDDVLADRLRMGRNHGELATNNIGLNLRMTEVTAAIACAQLAKGPQIIEERIEIAETLTDMVKDIPGIMPPVIRDGCTHVYYIWAAKVPADIRDGFVDKMVAEGVPLRKGYQRPLYELPAFGGIKNVCAATERVESELVVYENCGYAPTTKQLGQIREAFKKVGVDSNREVSI